MPLALIERWQKNPIHQALAQHPYREYALSNIPNLLGLWIQRTTVGWLTWEMTHSGFWLGAISMAELAPSLLLAPIAGVFADRYSRIKVLRITQGLIFLQALLFCLLLLNELLTIPALLGLVLIQGVVTSFAQPSRMALVSSMVPRQHLTSAVSLNAIIFNLARFLGPMLAGAGLVWLSPTILLGFSATGYCWFWGVLWYLKIQEEHVEQVRQTAPTGLIQSIRAGLHYARQHPLLGPWLAIFIILCLGVRQLAELLPGVSDLLFHQGVEGLALLSSGLGLGAVAGSLWMSQQPHEALPRIFRFSAWGLCLLLAILSWSPSFVLAVIVVAGCGLLLMVSGISTQTMLQLEVESQFRGRLLSLYGLVLRGGPAIGALLVGTTADWIGLEWPLTIAAALTGLVLWRMQAQIPNDTTQPPGKMPFITAPPSSPA
jgi:MFS family permease